MARVGLTPGESIRAFCVECVGSPHDVRDCGGDRCLNGGCDEHGVCWLFRYRLGHGRPSVKLIRKFCLYCQDDHMDWVKDCLSLDCPLFPFRMGRNPNISDETRLARSLRAPRSFPKANAA